MPTNRRSGKFNRRLKENDWNCYPLATRIGLAGGVLDDEIKQFESYLEAAQGLSGLPRKTGGTVERSRVAVTNAIRRSLKKIRKVHPELATHLEDSIRTGTLLAYLPAEVPEWQFEG